MTAADLAASLEPALAARWRELVARLADASQRYPDAALASSLAAEDMVLTHAIYGAGLDLEVFTLDTGRLHAETLGVLLRVLYPVVPHITWHLWRDLGYANELGDLLDAPWPHVDEAALVADEIELMLQVNGKLRGSIRVAAKAAKEDIEKLAAAQEEVARYLEGRPPKRVIVVPGKLVNVVG